LKNSARKKYRGLKHLEYGKIINKIKTISYNFNNKDFLMYNCSNLMVMKLFYKTFKYIFIIIRLS